MGFDQNSKQEDAPLDDERRAWDGAPADIFGTL